jgi:hypothetical protein
MMGHDLRRYSRQTSIRLFIGFLLILFLVGDGLIYVFYGPGAAILGFTCILIGLAPLLLVWLAFVVIDLVVKRANQE